MAAQPIETLLVSADGDKVVAALNAPTYHVQAISDPGKALDTLRDARYDLILLDDTVFSDEIVSVVKEIKRRVPLVPVLVLSDNADSAYQTDLMEAGADDFLTADLSGDEFQRRLRLILRQRRQAWTLAQRNQNLQSITTLSRRMHSATDPHALIIETIDLACATFKLYGMAVVLGDGDQHTMYAGKEGCSTDGTLYESVVSLKDYDPFRRVIQSGFVQVFQNIVADPYYVPIPVLPTPVSAIVLPLNYQDHQLGALAAFGAARHPLTHDDLLIYELFASQFTVALHNARHYHSQRISSQSSQHQLRAWQRFINLHTYEEVAENLQQLVEDIPNVPQALVWMYNNEDGETIVKARRDEVVKAFLQLEAEGHIQNLLVQLDARQMQPMTLQPGLAGKDPLASLFKGLRGQQLMLIPVQDSARFIGGIIASVVNNRQYSSEDAKLLTVSLAHAAGLALERTTLIETMAEKSGQLEALLRSTPQGIFFVDDSNHIAFCNPQFTELTGISPSEVLGHPPDELLNLLAQQTDEPERVLARLREAIQRAQSADPEEREDYPIVEITLEDLERDIHVEFTMIGDRDQRPAGWAGIIRDHEPYKGTFSTRTLLLDVMSERIRVPYAQVRGLITNLNDQHSRLSHRERARFLRQIEDMVDDLGHLWDNFLEMYNLEVSGVALSREEIDLYEMVQRILESRAFAEYRRQIQVDAPARLPLIPVDEIRMEQAVVNLLHNAVQFSPKNSSIQFKLEPVDDKVQIIIRDQGIGIPADQIERVFDPFFQASNNTNGGGAGLGLFLAQEVVHRHGGHIVIESTLGQGTTVTISLPVEASAEIRPRTRPPIREDVIPSPATPLTASPAPAERVGNGRRVSDRPLQTIMVVQGRSSLVGRLREKMDSQGYEMIGYKSGEEALRDVNSVRLDLILLDVNLPDANGLDVCERMCKRTEVPIIMLADEASEPEKVRALMIGADDYIAKPISDDELLARVNVIFKRRRIPDRTREPLDLGTLFIDFARREVFLNNKPLELTRIEYDLLHTLAVNQGQVLTHKQLLEKVWGPEYQAETQYLWVNVSRLRKKLEPTADSPRYIHTQPGVGYVFRPS